MVSLFARQCAIFIVCFLSISSVFGQSLMPGDLVVVGYNFIDPDEFSVLSLVNLPAGTQFSITDCGWNANTSAFRSGEGLITYTAPAGGIMAGQQIHYPDDVGFVTQGVSGFFGLSVAGDQLLIFQGSFLSPQFLFGLTDYNGGWLSSSFSPTNQSSHLPPGLLAGHDALELDQYLQAQFECAFPISNREEFLSRLCNPSQWIKSTDRVMLPIMGCGFDVLTENSLVWNYKMEKDQRLLLFVSSTVPTQEISWWYYTPEHTLPLKCSQLGADRFECQLPFTEADFLLIRPCQKEKYYCERYKKVELPDETDIFWYMTDQQILRLIISGTDPVLDASLYSSTGTLVWNGKNSSSGFIEIQGLKAGMYFLTVELAQAVHRVSISLTD